QEETESFERESRDTVCFYYVHTATFCQPESPWTKSACVCLPGPAFTPSEPAPPTRLDSRSDRLSSAILRPCGGRTVVSYIAMSLLTHTLYSSHSSRRVVMSPSFSSHLFPCLTS
ncbi:hypothetical protein CSUI_009945, partial [Cystoisospora suis]